MHILKWMRMDKGGQQAGETSFPLKQHTVPARRPISLQESQTGYKQSEPTGGAFTNKRTPHTEIQTGFFHSSPSCTRQHARTLRPAPPSGKSPAAVCAAQRKTLQRFWQG